MGQQNISNSIPCNKWDLKGEGKQYSITWQGHNINAKINRTESAKISVTTEKEITSMTKTRTIQITVHDDETKEEWLWYWCMCVLRRVCVYPDSICLWIVSRPKPRTAPKWYSSASHDKGDSTTQADGHENRKCRLKIQR